MADDHILVHVLLMNLQDVHDHSSSRAELLMTHVTLEMLGLLMLDQDLFVIELSVAVVAPWLGFFSLLLSHLELTVNQLHKKRCGCR